MAANEEVTRGVSVPLSILGDDDQFLDDIDPADVELSHREKLQALAIDQGIPVTLSYRDKVRVLQFGNQAHGAGGRFSSTDDLVTQVAQEAETAYGKKFAPDLDRASAIYGKMLDVHARLEKDGLHREAGQVVSDLGYIDDELMNARFAIREGRDINDVEQHITDAVRAADILEAMYLKPLIKNRSALRAELLMLGNPYKGKGGRFSSADDAITLVGSDDASIEQFTKAVKERADAVGSLDAAHAAVRDAHAAYRKAAGFMPNAATTHLVYMPEYGAWQAAISKVDEIEAARKANDKMVSRALLVNPPGGVTLVPELSSRGNPKNFPTAGKAADWLAARSPQPLSVNLKQDANLRSKGSGGLYNARTNTITIPKTASSQVVAHELGHALEYTVGLHHSDALILKLMSRPEWRDATKANELGKPHEHTLGSGVWNNYATRIYGDGATELLSTGLEAMHSHPADFARLAPEHFAWTVKMLRKQKATP